MSKHKHLGTKFDDFLQEEKILEETEALAIKQVLVYELQHEMDSHHLSKAKMAEMMDTSRAALDRLLDPENTSVTLNTMIKAANAINKKINIFLSDMRS